MQTSDFDPPTGIAQTIRPGLRRILAPNPSAMTFRGTNTYLLGRETLAVIDPGPQEPSHLKAILDAIATTPVEAIFVTHSHVDHSRLARPLAQSTGAPVLAFGDSRAGRSAIMRRLETDTPLGGGEGVDTGFSPDRKLKDQEIIGGKDWQITAYWTPGHFGNHMCFGWRDTLFTGDHVMGWASSLVSPPDGDLGDFMASCQRLLALPHSLYLPAHGAPVSDPGGRLRDLIRHREMRTRQILDALKEGPLTVSRITARVYTDTPGSLLAAAKRNVFAHLIDLVDKSQVICLGPLAINARFARI